MWRRIAALLAQWPPSPHIVAKYGWKFLLVLALLVVQQLRQQWKQPMLDAEDTKEIDAAAHAKQGVATELVLMPSTTTRRCCKIVC
jgi:hypothetical protein